MQDMLTKIVEMDEKARSLTAEAEKSKAESEKDIARIREDIYNDYIERARKRIEKNEAAQRQATEENWKKTEAHQQETIDKLEKLYTEKCDSWVNEIVNRVINS